MSTVQSVNNTSEQEVETPATRLRAAWNYATSPVDQGREAGYLVAVFLVHLITILCKSGASITQVPEPPPELKEWSQNTSLGVFSGLIFGGVGQWLRDRQAGSQPHREAMPSLVRLIPTMCCNSAGAFQPPQGQALNKPALARLQAEENTRRLVRIANETLRYKHCPVNFVLMICQVCLHVLVLFEQHQQP